MKNHRTVVAIFLFILTIILIAFYITISFVIESYNKENKKDIYIKEEKTVAIKNNTYELRNYRKS